MDKKEVINERIESSRRFFIFFIPFAACCLLFAGCSFPRIVILDDPLTPEEHINLGVAYEKKGEADNAIEEYKKASKELPSAYLYLGNAYMQKGDLDEAESHYKKAIRKQPDLADAYNNLAWLYYTKKENVAEAEELVLKALELKPSDENYKDTLKKIGELKNSGR
jgi:tetratricopeptide (TPR) repeat protein